MCLVDGVDPEILLVEDNEDDIILIQSQMKKYNGPKMAVVRDGQQAIDYLFCVGEYEGKTINFPKVMFLDLNMPRLSGLQVLRIIRAEKKTSLLPVVILTTSDDQKDIIESHEFGVNSYIKKPVDYDEFSLTIKELLDYWSQCNIISK